jgi:hypothetical protein
MKLCDLEEGAVRVFFKMGWISQLGKSREFFLSLLVEPFSSKKHDIEES